MVSRRIQVDEEVFSCFLVNDGDPTYGGLKNAFYLAGEVLQDLDLVVFNYLVAVLFLVDFKTIFLPLMSIQIAALVFTLHKHSSSVNDNVKIFPLLTTQPALVRM